MTEHEARFYLNDMRVCLYAKSEKRKAINMAIQALEEIQQYRAIGLTPKMVKEMIESEKLASHAAIIRGAELELYQAIGTVEELKSLKENGAFTGVELAQLAAMQMRLKDYQSIGTVEECRTAVERMKPLEPIRNDKCTCPKCGTHNEVIQKRRNTVAIDTVYCWYCGQAISVKRDWSE